MFLHIDFYIFAAIAILAAFKVVTTRYPVQGVLSLVVTFFAMAGIWMTLRAEFLSLILILVYVGAVMTLFLFVVMMLSVKVEARRKGFVHYLPFGILIVLLLVAMTMVAIGGGHFGLTQMPAPPDLPADYSNIAHLGEVLYTHYAYPFEIAGVLLLAAIIAAITLTHRGPRHRKVQQVNKQVAVKRADSVRLVKMPAEKKT